MLRALIHHWRVYAAVAAAVAVCGAVLTGALMVGDSIKASLRDLTLDRLGLVSVAMIGERFVRQDLVDDLSQNPRFGERFYDPVGAILLRGNAVHGASAARASNINVLGVDESFTALWSFRAASGVFQQGAGAGAERLDFTRRAGQVFPSVVINQALADELAAAVGDTILVRFRLGSEIPRDTLLGSREVGEVIGTLRSTVVEIIADRGFGRFDVNPHQTFPHNAYYDRQQLQASLDQPDRINTVLISGSGTGAEARELVEEVATLADLGLSVRAVARPPAQVQVDSAEFVLRPDVVRVIEGAAATLGAQVLRSQAYLANGLQVGDRRVPYSMVMAIDNPSVAAPFDTLRLVDGSRAPTLAPGEILINSWTAADLDASVGDTLTLSYYMVDLDEQLRTQERSFTIAGIVAMTGLAVDAGLTPEYPGIEGVENIADWDPPFPVDLSQIRDQDEAYWDDFRSAPKAFIAEATGRELWSTRYGATTSARLAVATDNADTFAQTFAVGLRERLSLGQFGFQFIDARQLGLDAAQGATDFAGLFVAFSFFLIASGLLIVSLLFSLGVARRSREIGLLLAVGYRARTVRARLLTEGFVVAAAGAALGLLVAVGYGRLMIWGLTTIWLPAVGSSLLFLHVEPGSLAMGFGITVLVVMVSIALTLRRLRRVPAARLLAGSTEPVVEAGARSPGRARWLAAVSAAAAMAVSGFALATGQGSNPGIAFAVGGLLLTAGLAWFALWCRAPHGRIGAGGDRAALAMAARSSAWNPERSMLSVALVAFASFVIVTVAGSTRDPAADDRVVEEGAGGYELVAVADIPVHANLEDSEARFDLGLSDENDRTLTGTTITSLRMVPGDDASCLNLYRPQRPRLLGMPARQIARGGFHFAASLAAEHGVDANPWELLTVDLGADVVPVIADANSAQWVLHLGLGQDLTVQDERGEPLRLRLVGTLRESVFQSEMLMSEEQLLRHFPSRGGFSYFLVDVTADRQEAVSLALEEGLSRFGLDVTGSAQKIADYLVVQNTYLSTFQALGGLGLLLGTLGLGVVLLRNVIERQGELATLRAFGFGRRFLSRLVLAENAFLLVVGVAAGALPALIALVPRLLVDGLQLPWATLAWTLGAVMVIGMSASVAAVFGALRTPLLPALKAER